MPAPITIKLRCASWKQLAAIYKRDLARSALFLKSSKPPPVGTQMRVNLTLPSETLIVLNGRIKEHIPKGGLEGRGPGIDIALDPIPQSAMWLIESALATLPAETSQVAHVHPASAQQAERQKTAPPPEPSTPTPVPSMESGAELVEAEDELLEAMKQELESLSKLNPFQVLGIGYETTDAAVRAAFGELTKRYHPDRFARYQSQDARHYASEIFILIRDSYRKLVDSEARARTLRVLENRRAISKKSRALSPTPTAASAARAAPAVGAPITVPHASRTAGPRTPSLDAHRAAAPSTPDLPLGDDSPANAERLLDEGKYAEALELFRLAAKRSPNSAKIRAGIELAAGLRAMAERDRLEAAQRFEAVLELDPTNERAARELAEMRRQATNDRRGLMARLLGKKN